MDALPQDPADLELLEWTTLFTQLEKDATSIQIVKILKLLSSLASVAVDEALLLGENPDFHTLGRFPLNIPCEVNHQNLLFLQRNDGWPSIVNSLSSLPFVEVTGTEHLPQQHIFLLAPKFRRWLQNQIRKDPMEDAQWTITAVLLLYRFLPSPLIAGWLAFDACKDLNIPVRQIKHVLYNLFRVCESLQEHEFVLLPAPQRLCCVLVYINWKSLVLPNEGNQSSVESPSKAGERPTELLLAKLAEVYWMDPLVNAILKAEEFLQAKESPGLCGAFESYGQWIKFSDELIEVLENLNEASGTGSASLPISYASDTLMALIFSLTSPSNGDILYRDPGWFQQRSQQPRRILTLLKRKESIREEAHRFRARLPPPSNDYERLRALILSYWFFSRSIARDRNHVRKYMEDSFPFAMDFLPLPAASLYFRKVINSLPDAPPSSSSGPEVLNIDIYFWAIKEALRIRPEVLYREPKGHFTITESPNNQNAISQLDKITYGIMEPLLTFPVDSHFSQAESIAAHHFLTIGNFPKRSAGQLQSTKWAPLSYAFHLLALLYFKKGEFLEAAVLASTYLGLVRLQTPLSWIPHIHRCIRILVLSLRHLEYLSYRDVSVVGQHVDTLLFNRLSHESSAGTWVWRLATPEDVPVSTNSELAQDIGDGKERTVPWDPKEVVKYDEEASDSLIFPRNSPFLRQLYGWFYLIDTDGALRAARRQLLASSSAIVERIFSADERIGIPGEVKFKVDEHMFCRLLACRECGDMEAVLAEYGLRPGKYRPEEGGFEGSGSDE